MAPFEESEDIQDILEAFKGIMNLQSVDSLESGAYEQVRLVRRPPNQYFAKENKFIQPKGIKAGDCSYSLC